MIKADKLQAVDVYPEVGWDPMTMSVDPECAVSRARRGSCATATRSRSG